MSPKETPLDPHTIFSTNPHSLFTPFTLPLPNGATLTGIAHIASNKGIFHSSQYKPLVVGIHGASCSAYNYDVNEKYTASTYADLTGIPFVAFNRPNYLGSGGWLRESGDGNGVKGCFEEEARWYHSYIFPALWETFGKPSGCTALVSTSHSMACPITVIAAGLYSSTPSAERTYPWAGTILFGIGDEPANTQLRGGERMAAAKWDPSDLPLGHVDGLHVGPFLKEDKIAVMLGPVGCCEAGLGELCWKQNTPFLLQELVDLNGVWKERKEKFKAKVRIPVLYGIGTMEWLWQHEQKHLEMFVKGFVNAPRVEGAVVRGAPHAIEWSPTAGGWWMRVFGWAVEVTVSREMEGLGLAEFD